MDSIKLRIHRKMSTSTIIHDRQQGTAFYLLPFEQTKEKFGEQEFLEESSHTIKGSKHSSLRERIYSYSRFLRYIMQNISLIQNFYAQAESYII